MDVEELPRRRFGRRRRRRVPRERKRRAIYLLPNLVTTAALMLGFWSMTRSFQGNYSVAGIAIILAGVLDMMDGRIARATHSTSRFGVQYDSLADLVSFGVAPAVLVYASALQATGGRGWAIAALYTVCAALRLARFNVQSESGPKDHNYGLPSTIAGGFVAVSVWFASEEGVLPATSSGLQVAATLGCVMLALLMVSGVPYLSWKNLPLSGRNAFPTLVGAVLLTIAMLVNGIRGFFAVGVLYVLSGPVLWLWLRRHPRGAEAPEPAEEARPHVH